MTEQQPFSGRVALVTGASGGIGRAVALALADAGATVAVHCGSGAAAARGLAETIASRGGTATPFGADLRDPDAPVQLVDRVAAELGPIALLVNNAGVGRRLTWEQTTLEASRADTPIYAFIADYGVRRYPLDVGLTGLSSPRPLSRKNRALNAHKVRTGR